eukprot:CAMPEP_0198719794 /NCGR_PEP_ID=MMETSP1471-20131121/58338_1 /TAXON_ID=41880 /ORGANISM="Pycnococcus provasolii, Strain RCC733" /LENGTH=129 /DNA_ID=CAMNT_0044480573 /DNA_START=4 /DNA_END=389 /DNA_ORIENTATION=+
MTSTTVSSVDAGKRAHHATSGNLACAFSLSSLICLFAFWTLACSASYTPWLLLHSSSYFASARRARVYSDALNSPASDRRAPPADSPFSAATALLSPPPTLVDADGSLLAKFLRRSSSLTMRRAVTSTS